MSHVYIIDGSRTPFLKARDRQGPFTAADLAIAAGRDLLLRQSVAVTDIDQVVVGCMIPSVDEATIARIIALRLGCGDNVPAYSVQRNCASGLQAIDSAAKDIRDGRADLVLAGGTDAMSHAPLVLNAGMTNWFMRFASQKTVGQRLKHLTTFKLGYLKFVISLLRGLTDPVVGVNMGQTAENLAHRFNITREQMDQYAVRSHQLLAQAFDEGLMTEVIPIYDGKGNVYLEDDGMRRDSTIEKLATLKPFFDKKFGRVTAGNSSQITDGAAMLLLASEKAVEKYHLPVLAKIVDVEWAALDPAYMGLGPVQSITPILQRHELALNDVDVYEINEAFAAQVLACLAAWQDDDYCKQHLGLAKAMGELSLDKLNVHGGAVAVGHPIGASGARVLLHVANVLKQRNAKRGIASLCVGGGQGGAMLIEREN